MRRNPSLLIPLIYTAVAGAGAVLAIAGGTSIALLIVGLIVALLAGTMAASPGGGPSGGRIDPDRALVEARTRRAGPPRRHRRRRSRRRSLVRRAADCSWTDPDRCRAPARTDAPHDSATSSDPVMTPHPLVVSRVQWFG